jgi:hypothetical protein
MTRRTGATLIEVLVAIFVMGIGMLALLTLFPIGVLTMRQAIQDDRSASSSAAATAIAKMKLQPSLYDAWFTQADQDYVPNQQTLVPAPSDGPSHALLLDTVGRLRYAGSNYGDWVGGQTNGIRRLPFPNPNAPTTMDALRWQISPDDVDFDGTGVPLQVAPNVFERNSAYSWAYLLRRPMQGKPNVVELTVVVFNDRPLALNNLSQAGETQFAATFNPASNVVSVTWNPNLPPPAVSVGGWIMDTTPTLDPNGNPNKFGPAHARFYRVVSLTQTGANSVDMEVQSPIKGFPLPPPSPANTFTGSIVVIEGIAEVFEKGPVQWQNP